MLKGRFSSENPHIALIYRLLILVVLFGICRLLFLIYNPSIFSLHTLSDIVVVIATGLRFDLSAIFILNMPFIALSLLPLPFREHKAYRMVTATLFITINSTALLANCLDCVYYPYTLKRTTADVFDFILIGEGGDFFRLLPTYLADFWYIILVWAAMVAVMIWLYKKTIKAPVPIGNKLLFYLRNTLLLVFGIFLWVFVSRGGFQLRPISIISAGENTSAQNIPLVLNTPFTIIQTIGSEQIEIVKYFDSEHELKKYYTPIHQYHNQPDSMNKRNVVIIILEGFSKESMSYANSTLESPEYKGYTPFLDSLSEHSLTFPFAFSNGKKSIEGIPAVIASLPNLMEKPYITSSYAGNAINSIPSLLKPYGYCSAFFHGGTNGTMQFDAFASLAGFDKYYGRTEYGNDADYDGSWGIWDEAFLQYTAQKLNTLKQPFVASVFTLSSHHPYRIPEKYQGRFDKGKLEIHESIGYADYALGRFFATASKTSWFSNTLFIITSDHSSATFSEYYQNSMGNLAIPMIYYTPSADVRGQLNGITQQIDILPSVMDYVKYPEPFFSFGESVLQPDATHFNICYFNNLYQLIYNDMLLQFNGENVLAVYDIKQDPFLRNNLVNDPQFDYKEAILTLKAILQTYFTRVKNNQLTVKP